MGILSVIRALLESQTKNPEPTPAPVEKPTRTVVVTPAEPVLNKRIEAALKYLGLQEVRDNKKLKKLLGMDPAEQSWCAAFVNAIERECGGQGTDSLAARSFLQYGKSTKHPEPGDIAVFWRVSPKSWQGHVAYYAEDAGDSVKVLGGNQGDKVCYKLYPKSQVLSYRQPVRLVYSDDLNRGK